MPLTGDWMALVRPGMSRPWPLTRSGMRWTTLQTAKEPMTAMQKRRTNQPGARSRASFRRGARAKPDARGLPCERCLFFQTSGGLYLCRQTESGPPSSTAARASSNHAHSQLPNKRLNSGCGLLPLLGVGAGCCGGGGGGGAAMRTGASTTLDGAEGAVST